jgi:hypothetical protein
MRSDSGGGPAFPEMKTTWMLGAHALSTLLDAHRIRLDTASAHYRSATRALRRPDIASGFSRLNPEA